MKSLDVVIIFVCFALRASASGPTSIFIDTIPQYSEIAPCAETQLSAIIRAQSSGCGDNQQTTSFACFCYQSSQSFDSIISTAVISQCQATDTNPAAQATSALEIFSSYCALGSVAAASASSASIGNSASSSTAYVVSATSPTPAPASTPSSTLSTSTSSPAAEVIQKSKPLSAGAIAGIVIGALCAAVLAAGACFILWRRRKATESQASELHGEAKPYDQSSYFSPTGLPPYEKTGQAVRYNQAPVEIESPGVNHLASSDTHEVGEMMGESRPPVELS